MNANQGKFVFVIAQKHMSLPLENLSICIEVRVQILLLYCCMQCIYVLFAFHWIVSFISGNKTTCTLSLYLILRLCIITTMYTTRNMKQLDSIHYYSHLLHIQFVVGGNLRIEWFSMSKLQFSFFIFLFNFLDAYRCIFLFIILFAIFNYKFEATPYCALWFEKFIRS